MEEGKVYVANEPFVFYYLTHPSKIRSLGFSIPDMLGSSRECLVPVSRSFAYMYSPSILSISYKEMKDLFLSINMLFSRLVS